MDYAQLMRKIMQTAINLKLRDMYLCSGQPPVANTGAGRRFMDVRPLTNSDLSECVTSLIPERCRRELDLFGVTDFSYELSPGAAFRIMVCRSQGSFGMWLSVVS